MTILVPADLRCPACGAPLPADDVNVARGVAVCRPCDVIYSLGDGADEPAPALDDLPIPSSLQVTDDPDVLVIERKWNRMQGLALGGFFALWDTFLIFWYSIALFADDGPQLLMMLFPLLHVAAGVGGTWTALANLFNTTRVEASAKVVRTKAGPIPTPGGDIAHDIADTVQFFVDRSTNPLRFNAGSTASERFRVCAFQRDGTVVPVHKGIDSLSEARAIERLLERRYGMRDVPLKGEVPRSDEDVAWPEVKPKVPVGSGSVSLAGPAAGGEVGLADREGGAISLSPVGPRRRREE